MTEGTKILKCSCKHEEQDKMHGNQNRVHNSIGKPNTKAFGEKSKCTVCGTIK